jgi:hypothetical protein
MDLNPAQYDAVNTLAGPLLVLAGAEIERIPVLTYPAGFSAFLQAKQRLCYRAPFVTGRPTE